MTDLDRVADDLVALMRKFEEDNLRDRTTHLTRAVDDITRLLRKFDPHQPRDPHTGKWMDGPGGVGTAAMKTLSGDKVATAPKTHGGAETIEQRLSRINAASDALYAEYDTATVHRTNGRWDDERARIHKEIVDEVYARYTAVPSERKALVSAGLAGAGKTTTLKSDTAGVNMSQYVVVNADDMKEELLKRGLQPTIPGHEDWAPMEHSTLIHSESAFLAQTLAQRAYADGKNVIIDTTLGGDVEGAERLLGILHEQKYSVRGILVDVPVEVSLQRASGRYRHDQLEWTQGRGFGGRPVSEEYILEQRLPNGGTKNRRNFESLTDQMQDWQIFDNSADTGPPILVAQKMLSI